MAVTANLVDAPINLKPVTVGVAEFDRDLATGTAAASKVDFCAVLPQMVMCPHDFVQRGDLKGDMVEVRIRRRLPQRADQRDPVMIRVAAQKDHAAGHHLFGINVRNLKAQDLGVEAR